MKGYLFKALVTFAALSAVLVLSTPTQAQRRGRGYSKADVNRIIARVENRSDQFVRQFDRSLDRGRLDDTRREDRLNERAGELERALDDLRREFDRTDRYMDTRSQVSSVMNIAEGINGVMRRRRMGGQTERSWNLLRTDLNTLAAIYNLRQLRR